MQGQELNQLEEFKCPESTAQSVGGPDKEMVKRIQIGWSA